MSAKLAHLRVSAGIDTGSAVDIISLDTYNALRRASRGGRYALLVPPLHLDFYVLANLALPCDAFIGLASLRAHRIAVHPDRHSVTYKGREYAALDVLQCFASPWVRSRRRSTCPSSEPTVRLATAPPMDSPAPWTSVNAVVRGRHEIPARCAHTVPVKVVAPPSTHACFEDTSFVHSLRIEPTLLSIAEQNKTVALVINMTGANVLLQPGTCLTRALVYSTRVVDTDLPSTTSSAAVVAASLPGGEGNCMSLDSHVKAIDCPALKAHLLETLQKFRGTIALPGETLGATTLTKHSISLKPGTVLIYIPANRLPLASAKWWTIKLRK